MYAFRSTQANINWSAISKNACSDFGSHPYSYRDNKLRDQPVALGTFPIDSLTNQACSYIREHRDEPFFLFLSQYYVHDPVHSRCDWLIEKYKTRLGGKGPKSRAAYGAMVETIDHNIGQVLATIAQQNLDDRTVVFLMSDNGGHPNHTTNAPLRGSKWNLYEGGIRVPLIVRWPQEVPANTTCDTVVHGCDLLPTIAELLNTPPASDSIDGTSLISVIRNPHAKLDRKRPLVWHFPYYHPEKKFLKSPPEIGVGDFVTSQTRPHSAIRRGDWKLLSYYETDRVELYDLANDISESRDVAADNQELAADLQSQLFDTLRSMNARFPVSKP